jgi:DNA-binding MarR family transcriptional regulator
VASVERALSRLLRLAEARRSASTAESTRGRLDRAAYAALARLEEMPATRLTELAAMMSVDLSTASRQVRGLEARGFVVRIDDPDDQRTAWLELTEAGQEALTAERALRVARIASHLANWKERDVAELARLLGQLVTSFSEPSGVPAEASLEFAGGLAR